MANRQGFLDQHEDPEVRASMVLDLSTIAHYANQIRDLECHLVRRANVHDTRSYHLLARAVKPDSGCTRRRGDRELETMQRESGGASGERALLLVDAGVLIGIRRPVRSKAMEARSISQFHTPLKFLRDGLQVRAKVKDVSKVIVSA